MHGLEEKRMCLQMTDFGVFVFAVSAKGKKVPYGPIEQ